MTPEQLTQYIRSARIYNIYQLEQAAGIPAGTLAKALLEKRKLPKKAVGKILKVLQSTSNDLSKADQ